MDRSFSGLWTTATEFGAASSSVGVGGASDRARDSLLLMARLRSPALPQVHTVRVRNLSAGGLMAEFAEPLDRGTSVEVEVRGLGWVPGKVAWFTEGRTGIAFDKPVDPQRARKPVGQGRGKQD